MSTPAGFDILLATSNPGKRREFLQLLPPAVSVKTLDDVHVTLPEETGATFAENAALKAIAASAQSGLLTLADDSGLEVAALGGDPGVRSARYAGVPPSDDKNRAALLAALRQVPAAARQARFVCAVSLARGGTLMAEAEGICVGIIASAPAGLNGFGYDPLFQLADGRAMAELPATEKNEISHRARAYRAILPALLAAIEHDPSTGAR
ncbi:MAG: RdgB/HAM1 family non-canonical purine NTP pyrophosphatase [Chloroflexota bacterium]|nr:RdgB/HAM1 family non-canonical purine NTP pyrophosphatase [Chloroflexota bacterium]